MFARMTNFLKFSEKQKRNFLKASQGELAYFWRSKQQTTITALDRTCQENAIITA